jgi:hypothetical protein
LSPLTGRRSQGASQPWWKISDFDPAVGDIKPIWELSRFDWMLAMAQRARMGDQAERSRLERWLQDWIVHNPPYLGPNWKCGQEASIRVLHIALAAMILGQVETASSSLVELVRLHLRRIAPTMQYAVAQENNHGTSEAAALFVGGSWMASLGVTEGHNWARTGRRWLENRVVRLVGADGSFSQYSLNYHRLLLETLCIVEVWRRHLDLPSFSSIWRSRASAAADWLRHLISPVSGDGPNVGANDGAHLFRMTDAKYRDYRPSVYLATALFSGKSAYPESGPWSHYLDWIGVKCPTESLPAPGNYLADDGGFAVLRRGIAMVMLRYPRFRFRPSQADVLHMDVWLGAVNILRDAGTYSYNADPASLRYFTGTGSHNTVQFDDRDQMPRLGRFLFGSWLETERLQVVEEDDIATRFGAGYRDSRGARHYRAVTLWDAGVRVVDDVEGFKQKAVLRWRLEPRAWGLENAGDIVRLIDKHDGRQLLTVSSSKPIFRCELVEGWESDYYARKTPVPVLEVEVAEPCSIFTEIRW